LPGESFSVARSSAAPVNPAASVNPSQGAAGGVQKAAKAEGGFPAWAEGLLLISNDTKGRSVSAFTQQNMLNSGCCLVHNNGNGVDIFARCVMPDEGLSRGIIREVLRHTGSAFASPTKVCTLRCCS
jgi:hypothetical protein